MRILFIVGFFAGLLGAQTLVHQTVGGVETLAPLSGGCTTLTGAATGPCANNTLRDIFSAADYPYLAVADGTTDNYAALTSAVTASCAATTPGLNGFGASLLLPGGASQYRISRPLVIPCGNFSFIGEGPKSILKQLGYNFGPTLVVRPGVATNFWPPFPTTTSLVGSGGNAMLLDGSETEYLDIGEVLGIGGSGGSSTAPALSGLSAFTVEAWIKPTTVAGDATFLSSFGTNQGTTYTAYRCGFNGGASAQVYCHLNVAGTDHVLTSSVLISANTTHMIALSYDGTTIRLFQDGTSVATASATGTITQAIWENQTVGPLLAEFPRGAPISNSMTGAIDNIRVSNNARYTSNFTPATTKYTSDANTLLLLTFANNYDAFTQSLEQAGPGWLMYRTTGLTPPNGSFLGGPVFVSHMILSQGSSNSGLSVNFVPGSYFGDIGITGGMRGFNFESNCYECTLDLGRAQGQAETNLALGQANTVFTINRPFMDGGAVNVAFSGDPDASLTGCFMTIEPNTLVSVNINAEGQAYDHVGMHACEFSTESIGGGASVLTTLVSAYKVGWLMDINDGSSFGNLNGIPSITLNSNMTQVSIRDTTFAGSTTVSPILINSAPTFPVVYDNVFRTSTAQPISNLMSSMQFMQPPTYTVANLPACSAGQLAFVSDASSPTYLGALTGGGAAATTAVICKATNTWVSH